MEQRIPGMAPLEAWRADGLSLAMRMALLPEAERLALLRALGPEGAERLLHDWRFWGRPGQLPPPGAWRVWLVLAGRGFGKTRAGAEWVRRVACSLIPSQECHLRHFAGCFWAGCFWAGCFVPGALSGWLFLQGPEFPGPVFPAPLHPGSVLLLPVVRAAGMS